MCLIRELFAQSLVSFCCRKLNCKGDGGIVALRELNPYIADITSFVFIYATMCFFSIGE